MPERNVEQVIALGLRLINRELTTFYERRAMLSTWDAQSVGTYLKAALAMAKEEREGHDPRKMPDAKLDEEIAKHLGVPFDLFREVLEETKRRAAPS